MSSFFEKYKKHLFWGLPIFGSYLGVKLITKKVFAKNIQKASKLILNEPYDQNLWEIVSATKRSSPQTIIENSLRAQEGKAIDRPLGTPKKFPSLDDLMFNIAQIHTMPTPDQGAIDLTTVIGKNAAKPLQLSMPVIVSAMAYGFALSEPFKIALAQGASLAGTASNTGEGPFLPKEREAAHQLILQYNRGYWNKNPDILKQANMLELQFGQGASAGTAHSLSASKMSSTLRKRFGIKNNQSVLAGARIPDINSGPDLIRKVRELRSLTEGIPIGIKMGAGKYLEQDLEWALKAEVDVVCLDGAEAATKGSNPILQDDFGVPTIYALARANNFLERINARQKVDLIVSGGLRTPGHFLKAIALGADAVYIGTAALFATAGLQALTTIPYKPPTQLTWETGKYAKNFNVEQGTQSLQNFLLAVADEMRVGMQALGKESLQEINKNDLMALNQEIAQALDIKAVYDPCLYDG